jgi:hypothetical protein
VDPLRFPRDEGGQSHLLAVLAAAIAIVALVALLAKQEELVAAAASGRAAEAAAQAAGAIVADEHVALVSGLRDARGAPRDPTRDELLAFLADPGLAERALAAARAVSAENRGTAPWRVSIVDRGESIEVSVDAGRWHRVSIEKVSCCRR